MLCFDDRATAMYRKIDTTPLSAKFPDLILGLPLPADPRIGPRLGRAVPEIGCVVSSFIFSRMTLRPVFAPAGAIPERMIP